MQQVPLFRMLQQLRYHYVPNHAAVWSAKNRANVESAQGFAFCVKVPSCKLAWEASDDARSESS